MQNFDLSELLSQTTTSTSSTPAKVDLTKKAKEKTQDND
jgi:hypothetical protein